MQAIWLRRMRSGDCNMIRSRQAFLGAIAAAFLLASTTGSGRPAEPPPEADRGFRAAIEADWARQEARSKRRASDPTSVRAALERFERLYAHLSGPDAPSGMPAASLERARKELRRARKEVRRLSELEDSERLRLYLRIRWAARELALANPLFAGKPIAFLERRRFVCQMLHEYLGYFYDYGDVAGGGVYVLERPATSFEARRLAGEDRLGKGNFATLSVSYDGRTLYFAFARRADRKPRFYSPERQSFHIYAIEADGTGLRQLTFGPDDDFDPCELPDGGIAFMSTRRGGFCRCNNEWEPISTYTLHRMERDGSQIRTLSFHETNEWHPSVLADGRIAYSRWDYVDRSAANFHGIWVTNPDGTGAAAIFGNYTARINACYQPRAVPGSRRIVFVAGAHHANVGGALVLLDPARTGLDPRTGEDSFDAIEVLTPEIRFPEAPGWPKSYFHSPWPLSEAFYLVAFSYDPLPGMSSVNADTETGLYLFDSFGGLELLYRKHGIPAMYPVPLAARPKPPAIASTLDPELGDEGEFLLTDVRRSLFPLPEGRAVREDAHGERAPDRLRERRVRAHAPRDRAGRRGRVCVLPRAGEEAALLPGNRCLGEGRPGDAERRVPPARGEARMRRLPRASRHRIAARSADRAPARSVRHPAGARRIEALELRAPRTTHPRCALRAMPRRRRRRARTGRRSRRGIHPILRELAPLRTLVRMGRRRNRLFSRDAARPDAIR